MAKWLWLSIPPTLLAMWEEMNDHPLTAIERLKKAEEERKDSKRLRKSLRRSMKNSQKSKAPSVAFEGELDEMNYDNLVYCKVISEGDGSVVIQASPKNHHMNQSVILPTVDENGIQQPPPSSPQSPNSNGQPIGSRGILLLLLND
jgi:phosphomevalonate kinase